MIKIKRLEIKPPGWKWWQYLAFLVGLILVIKGDYDALFTWIKSYL